VNQTHVSETEMTAERVDRFSAAWLRCDLDELRDFLTVDALYSPLSGEVVRGREAVIRRFAETLADDAGTEVRFEPASVSGSLGACRWHLTVHTAEGASFQVEGIDVYEFEGDRIRSKDVYQKA
jgi:ketosteroid isomerase-like protein